MTKRLVSYLRPYRRRWGFTQPELGYIIAGTKGRTLISRLENETCQPSLAAALALQIVFGTEPAELFPALCAEVKDSVVARAYETFDKLQGDSSKANKIKLDFLEEMFARAKRGDNSESQI